MYDRKLSRNSTELALTAELPTWNSIPMDSMACPLMYLTEMMMRRSMYVSLSIVVGGLVASYSSRAALDNTGSLTGATSISFG